MTIDDFLALAREDPRIVGVVLTGSRARDVMRRADSDWDLRVFVADGEERLAADLQTPHGSTLEIAATTVSGFRDVPHWDRYAYTHARVLIDKLGGAVGELVDSKGRLSAAEADRHSRAALDSYMNSLHRSLKSSRLGLGLQSRLDACESVTWLLEAVFAFEQRVRPFHKYLAWELETHPLAEWEGLQLRASVEGALEGDPSTQQAIFRQVEARARRLGYGDVVDGWAHDLADFRGE